MSVCNKSLHKTVHYACFEMFFIFLNITCKFHSHKLSHASSIFSELVDFSSNTLIRFDWCFFISYSAFNFNIFVTSYCVHFMKGVTDYNPYLIFIGSIRYWNNFLKHFMFLCNNGERVLNFAIISTIIRNMNIVVMRRNLDVAIWNINRITTISRLNSGSRTVNEVKQCRASSVSLWGIACEYLVLNAWMCEWYRV